VQFAVYIIGKGDRLNEDAAGAATLRAILTLFNVIEIHEWHYRDDQITSD
jgi:hypothetical protein